MSFSALLFDLDGTVADSLPVLFDVYRTFLAAYGIEGSREEFAQLNGPSLIEGIGILKAKYGIDLPSEELYARYCALFQDQYSALLKAFPGTEDFLGFVHSHAIPMAMVTSSPRALAQAFLRAQGLDHYFAALISGDEVTRSKPDPQPYLLALAQLNVCGEQALVIEDSTHGIHAGLAAGVPTVKICHRPDREPSPRGTLAVVESWAQLRRLIEARVVHV
jgi:HAD superfamily hydrolase (TIGR01509 family)